MILRSLMILNSCGQYDVRMWRRFEETGEDPESFIDAGRTLWSQIGITDRCCSIMEERIAKGWADRELEMCERTGTRIVTFLDGIYPQELLNIDDAPLLLYMRGDIFSPGHNSIAVVGTRKCSPYAREVAHEIGRRAAVSDICVISGGAKGIDAAAHQGALDGGGRTIAVFGTGVDKVYPADHRVLFEKIRERGALWSEYPLGTIGEARNFPRRNRIVAGVSSRIVVAEAPKKSGAMITARLGAEYGREVWSVPGRINSELSAGSNRLIFDGAMPLIDMDLLFGVEDGQRLLFSDTSEPAAAPDISSLSDVEKTLVALLSEGNDRTIDNLASEAKISAAEAFKLMSMLALRGVVAQSGPGRYRLTDR